MVFPFTSCSLCRPQRQDASSADGSGVKAAAGGPLQPASVPQMLRSKSGSRILQVDGTGKSLGSDSRMQRSQSILEASRRRLAESMAAEAAERAQKQVATEGAAAREFVQQYMQAIKDGNTSWASAPAVGQLFTEDACMVSVDRQTFQGRSSIVRRLNQGVETLVRMAGEQSELPTFELTGPHPVPGTHGALQLRLALKRGLHKMAFTMTFHMREGKIAQLHNSRS